MTASSTGPGSSLMPLRVVFLSFLAAILPKAWASCPTATTNLELSQDMTRAEKAYSNLDLDGFNTAIDALRTDLPCAGEPITKDIAARMHRVEGLRSYVDQDRRSATQSFAAARVLEPDYRFPETLVPAGYPELEMYDAINVSLGSRVKVPPMIDGYILFDGRVGLDRNTEWPTVVQVVNENGDVVVSAYLRPGQPMPNYYPGAATTSTAVTNAPSPDSFKAGDGDDSDPFADVLNSEKGEPKTSGTPHPSDDDADLPEARTTAPKSPLTHPSYDGSSTLAPRPATPHAHSSSLDDARIDARIDNGDKTKKKPTGLLIFSLTSVVASGASYAVALHAADTYRDTATPLDQLDSLRGQANLWSGIAAGAGVLALGTGIAVGVRW